MRFSSLPLTLLLLLSVQADAALSASRIHQAAIRHSKSLAGNIRLAFRSVLVEQSPPSRGRRQTYCSLRKSDEPVGSGHLPASGNSTANPVNPPEGGLGQPSASRSAAGTRTRTTSPSATPSSGVTSPWKLTTAHAGQSFFDGWAFFTLPDPTHGNVDYVDEATARANNLVSVNERGNVIMAVETTDQVAANRKSVRITTKNTFSIGSLLIMSSLHIPTGCGTWPAWWTNGPNWPNGGEIDIFEPIHQYSRNQAALHTAEGCHMPSTSSTELGITGEVLFTTNCGAASTGNTGCGVRFSTESAGKPFNDNQGGVYAMQLVDTGISIWFSPRGQIPQDINTETPLPDTWGQPQARFPSTNCDPVKFFYDQVGIFDTTLCGDWAGNAWTTAGIPGQEESCQQRTGVATCEEFVRTRGSSFQDAYWEVEYVKLFSL